MVDGFPVWNLDNPLIFLVGSLLLSFVICCALAKLGNKLGSGTGQIIGSMIGLPISFFFVIVAGSDGRNTGLKIFFGVLGCIFMAVFCAKSKFDSEDEKPDDPKF